MGIAHRKISRKFTQKSKKQHWIKPLPAEVKTLSDWLQVRLQKAHFSPHHLAMKIGVPACLVKTWILGTAEPNERHREVLAKFFGGKAQLVPSRAGQIGSCPAHYPGSTDLNAPH